MSPDDGRDGDLLYLFSSNQNPLFEEDAINAVCLPAKFIMHFRYRPENLDDALKNLVSGDQRNTLIGKKVLVIFVNVIGRERLDVLWDPEFYPLRSGRVIEIKLEGDRIHFFFELEDEFIDYEKYDKAQLDSAIRKLKYKPEKGDKPGYYIPGKFAVLQASVVAGMSVNGQSGRIKIIERLLEVYPRRLFYSFEVRLRGREAHELVSPNKLQHENLPLAGYELSQGKRYSILFNYYFNPGKAFQFPSVTLSLNDASGTITTSRGSITLGNRSDVREILITPHGVSTSTKEATFEIAATDSTGSQMGRFEIPMQVNRSYAFLLWLIVIAAGLIIGSIFPNVYAHIGGSLLTTFGVFFLARSYK